MKIDINKRMKQSQKAICGTFERQITVDPSEVEAIKKALKSKGQMIVGTGNAGVGKKYIWYNPQGVNF